MSTASDLPELEAEVVELYPYQVAEPAGADLADDLAAGVVDLAPNAWTARWANRQIIEATRHDLARSARWHGRALCHQVAWFVTHLHILVWRELRPITHGLVDLVRGIRRWQRCAGDRERLDATETRDVAEKLWEKRYAPKVQRRFWCLFVTLVLTTGLGYWGYLVYGWPVPILAAFLVLGLADVLGRRTHPVEDPASPPPMPILIDDPDVPMSQLQLRILEVFEREGFAPGVVGIAQPLHYDPTRLEYRMVLSCLDEIKPQHLRAVERGLGAEEMTARLLSTGVATNRALAIRQGDPFADVPTPSWIESGARSISDPADLGMAVGDVPFSLKFAGLHAVVVGRTGSGKTKGALWAIIDRLSACHDVVMWGVDLMNGPHLSRWEGVLQRTAYTPEDTQQLLADAIELIHQRGAVLKRDEDADEWHSGLGPALVLILDEFAVLAQNNGEKRTLPLLADVETILRMGRKVWVTIVLGTQKAGNSDLGSTLVESQVSIKMLLACRERDTVTLLGTDARDGGWAPHFLTPADDDGAVNDAGKLYLDSPRHRTPDVYRCWSPLTGREVRDRVKRRIADGLPTLAGGSTADTVEVPDVLAFIEARFVEAGNPVELASAAIVARTGWTQASLAKALRPHGMTPTKIGPRDARVSGYRLADLQTALRGLS